MRKAEIKKLIDNAGSVLQQTGPQGGLRQSAQIRVSTSNTPFKDLDNALAMTKKITDALESSGIKYQIGAQWKDAKRIAEKKIKQKERKIEKAKKQETIDRYESEIEKLKQASGKSEDEILIYITI